MPKHKKKFIDRKTATNFALVQRSQQDKYADDSEAPQHVLKDISRKKQQQKYGVFFEDEYDYLQHLRCPFSKETEGSDEEIEEESVAEEGIQADPNVNHVEDEDLCGATGSDHHFIGPELRLHETLMGYDEPMYDSRVIGGNEEVDEEILEAMRRAEEGEEDEEDGLADDFIHMASGAAPDDYEDDMEGLTNTQQALMSHFLGTLGEEGTRLAEYGIDEDEDDEEDVVQHLRDFNSKMESRGEDYHSQCLGLQIERLVEEAVTYDVDEIRSRLSGVSCALTEAMTQALETDKRLAEQRLVKDPECLMTIEEKEENIARTLAIVDDESRSNEEDEEDPVQAWDEFDRRPRVTANVDSDRVGYQPIDDVLASCTVHPAAVSLKKVTSRKGKSRTSSEMEPTEKTKESELPERQKGESSDERRLRKLAVKAQQRDRRAAKKENKMTFKAESARQRAMASSMHVTHSL